MKVIVIPRVLRTRGIFHFHKIRLQFFINSSKTKVVFPFNSIPTKNTNLKFLWKKGKIAARTCRIPEYIYRCFERTKDKTK